MKSIRYNIVFALTAIAAMSLMLGSCHKKGKTGEEGEPTVNVAYPTEDSITLYSTYPGQVYAPVSAEVSCRASGQLLRQCYTDGAKVEKGQLLFIIESTKYRDAVAQCESALATARSEYEYSSRQYEALKKALKSDAVSQMDVIQAKSNMEKAAAAIKDASAALSTARTNLSYCEVRAPITGLASAATLNPGDYVGGEASPVVLTTIYNSDRFSVRFNIEDSRYEKILSDNGGIESPLFRKVPITFANPLPHDYTIDLYYDSPTIDPSTGTLLVKGRTPNQDNELKDGMYCTVHLPYGTDPHAILIRDASIGTDQLGKYVYVVNDSDKVVYTHIEVGDIYQDTLRVVTKGLTPKQRYVTDAILKVRDGEKVKPRLVK